MSVTTAVILSLIAAPILLILLVAGWWP